jgi:RNA polymerase sigma-70 factor, ECF subfamily
MRSLTAHTGPESPEEPTDAGLVALTLAGDAAAFELLVRRHYGAAHAVALAVLGNRADAEDACHDAFVRAAERLEDCRQPDRFGPWLRTVVRNHARNALARRAVRRAAPLDAVTGGIPAEAEREVEREELARRLEAAMARLKPAEREVLLLHDLEDWTHEEIARDIGVSVVMSRQHLFQARRRLRAMLGGTLLEEYRDG